MRLLKWIGIVLGGLIVLVALVVLVLHVVGGRRLSNAPEIATRPVVVPDDEAAVARGEHLIQAVSICGSCHAEALEGTVFFDGELGSYVPAPNLTAGQGGIGAGYSDADWERAIRHGVGSDNRVLVIMPSHHYAHFSDADLGALIAYIKSLPPVDNDLGERRMGFPGTVLGGVLAFNDFTRINAIDHEAVGTEVPPEGATAEYGRYVVQIAACSECHGDNLAGLVADAQGPPPGPNITPGGRLGDWNEQEFITTIRTGVTPDGNTLDPELMPWPAFSQMTDTELQAIWAYLQSLPALPANNTN